MRGVIPTDLTRLPETWTPWPLEDRITAAKELARVCGYTPLEAQVAVTISMNEQPHSIPVDNCCGIIVAGATRPWGWTTWPVSPVGYSAGPEGEGGEAVSVFFAFNSPQGSLWKLLTSVRRRGIKDAVTYALGWVSDPAQYTESVDGFNGQWRTVTERWTA